MKYFPKRISIPWVKECYRLGILTPEELADEIITRAEKRSDANVWIIPPSKKFLRPYLEKLKETASDNLPLWGIPFAIKDNIDLAQNPTTAACPDFSYMAEESSEVVSRLIAAGAFPVGKTNLDQFATGLVGTRSPYGECHNALVPELISGGSSAGSAVSVALGMSCFALGTDTAGSGRVPAALNALVGYKPSLGAWSTRGVVPACASLDCVTVFAGSLADAMLVDGIARGFDERCPWSKSAVAPISAPPKRIVLPKDEPTFYGDYAEVYRSKWREAVRRIEGLGIKVEYIDVSLFSEAASILYDGPWVAERWKDLGEFVTSHPGSTMTTTEMILRNGEKPEYTAKSLFESIHLLQDYKQRARALMKDAVLVMPTAGGTFTREQVRENPVETNSLMGLYTNHCNLLDMCAVAIPENDSDDDMPFGITIFASSDSEGLIVDTARAFLESQPVRIAVCGQHMRGMALHNQLIELGARFVEQTMTAQRYKMVLIDSGLPKPGLIRVDDRSKGAAIEVETYDLSVKSFGKLVASVSSPLGFGEVELEDGSTVKGFICEGYRGHDSLEIDSCGSFRKFFEEMSGN